MVVRRIGMREVPTERREVPHEWVGDDGGGVRDDRITLSHDRVRLEVRLADEGADAELAVLPDRREAAHAIDVDEETRLCESELHQRDEALASREHLALPAGARQQLDGVRDVVRDLIVEGRRDHGSPLAPTPRDRLASPAGRPTARHTTRPPPGGVARLALFGLAPPA